MARGHKTGGRETGTRNKVTVEREQAAAAAVGEARAREVSGVRTSKTVLRECMNYFMGLAALVQPGTAARPNAGADEKKFERYLALAGDFASKLAPYEHPRLGSITLRPSSVDLSKLSDAELALYEQLTVKATADADGDQGRAGPTSH